LVMQPPAAPRRVNARKPVENKGGSGKKRGGGRGWSRFVSRIRSDWPLRWFLFTAGGGGVCPKARRELSGQVSIFP